MQKSQDAGSPHSSSCTVSFLCFFTLSSLVRFIQQNGWQLDEKENKYKLL